MRLITYKCDRCNQKIESRGSVMKVLVQDFDFGELIDMDICPECTDKLSGFLGIESLCQEGGVQDE